MNIGEKIDAFIQAHIRLWHSASPARTNKSLSSEERVKLFMKTKRENVIRAQVRDSINQELRSGFPDPKMNYMAIEED